MLDEASQDTVATERLPFRIRIAAADELQAVARLRVVAYGRHLPVLAARLGEPEEADDDRP